MAIWHTYVGNFTKEFTNEIDYVDTSRRALRSLTPDDNKPDRRQVDPVARYSEGIERYTFDDEAGSLVHKQTIGGLPNPQYFATHPFLPVLYSTEWMRTGRLLSFQVNADGTLGLLSSIDTHGELSEAVAVHPSGHVAYVAHWGDGTITACPLDERGAASGAEPVVLGNQPGYFEREHLHDARVTDDGNYLVVTDVGGDDVISYQIDAKGAVSSEPCHRIRFPAHSHPRNIAFHPSGRFAFVGGQWDSMLYVLSVLDGKPSRIIAATTTMPSDFDGDNAKIAQLAVHPDGRTVYVTNRNSRTIAVFTVHDSGVLEPLGHQPTRGHGPSTAAIHPSGRYLLVGSVFSGAIEVFAVKADGQLKPVGEPVDAHAPRAMAFFAAETAQPWQAR